MNDAVETESEPTLAGSERRRGLRISQARPVKIFEPTAGRYFGGQTEDVSSTGLRVELPRSVALKPGKVLSVHVGLSSSGETLANRRQMIPAKVVWISRDRDAEKPRLTVGLEFMAAIAAHADAA